LEGQLEVLLQLMGKDTRDEAGLAANAREADAMFGQLAVDDTTKSAFSELMRVLVVKGDQQDEIAARFAEIPNAELTGLNEEIAEATEQLRQFHAIVEALVFLG
jgi:hypothetical protein